MSITRDDYELSWLSENYFENKDLFCASDIILQIAQVKIPELILDRSSQSSPAGSYKMANFDCLSYMDFTSNQDEKPEITKIPEETKTADSYSPSLPLVKNLKVSAKKEKKLAAVKSICGICQMEFKHKWIYERHLESHSTAKYYKCQVEGCNKSYKSKENLNLHNKNIHLNIKPYTCTYCELRFSHRNGKTYHERKFHVHYLPHTCKLPGCSKAFASKSALNYHLNNQHKDVALFNKV